MSHGEVQVSSNGVVTVRLEDGKDLSRFQLGSRVELSPAKPKPAAKPAAEPKADAKK